MDRLPLFPDAVFQLARLTAEPLCSPVQLNLFDWMKAQLQASMERVDNFK